MDFILEMVGVILTADVGRGGAGVEQHFYALGVAVRGGHVERRDPVHAAERPEALAAERGRARDEQEPGTLCMAVLAGDVQRGLAVEPAPDERPAKCTRSQKRAWKSSCGVGPGKKERGCAYAPVRWPSYNLSPRSMMTCSPLLSPASAAVYSAEFRVGSVPISAPTTGP